MDFISAKAFILDKLSHELSAKLTYHGVHHTIDVYKTVLLYAGSEGIKGGDFTLLRTAALFHDSGFVVTYHGHEEAGCEIARCNLPGFGYSDEQINRICGMIMATKLPQNPQNHLEQIMSDCDLDYLGRSDFYLIGSTLFEEFKTYGVVANEQEWNHLQIRFLEEHSYFTKTAMQLRQPLKNEHLAEIRRLANSYPAVAAD